MTTLDDKYLVAEYRFEDNNQGTPISTRVYEDSATDLDGVAQTGTNIGSSNTINSKDVLDLDGHNDAMLIAADDNFQIGKGAVSLEFNQDKQVGCSDDTLISRDSKGFDDGGHLTIRVTAHGAVTVRHQTETHSYHYDTPNGFFKPGDDVRVTYQWDEDGVDGRLLVENLSTGRTYDEPITQPLTIDMGDDFNEPWTVGAGQIYSGDNKADHLTQYFNGQMDNIKIYDLGKDIASDGIVSGTDGDDYVDVLYDGDPDGDFVDNDDAILPGEEGDDDIIVTGDGSDTVYAGNGNDEIDTSGPDKLPDLGYPGLFPADADPENDRDYVDGGAGNDVIVTGDDRDTIVGGTGDDTIDGGVDADDINGGQGDDRIVGGEGSDTIIAGEGDDLVYAGIDPDLGLPDNLDIPDDIDLVPNNGKDLVDGGAGNDTIYGADDDDTILGGSGDDFLDGGIDSDFVTGGTGDDTIIGGQGADTLKGGDGRDVFQADPNGSPADAEMIGDSVNGGAGGDDFDILDLTGVTPDGITRTVNITGPDSNGNGFDGNVVWTDSDGNVVGTLEFAEIEKIIPCFTPGTRIATPKGEVLVEDLREGDRIITRDNGIQTLRWVGAREISDKEMGVDPSLRPIRIAKGALGHGLPERDMLVSPQHRILIANARTELFFEEREVLVAAKHLVGMPGITQEGPVATTYIHFMCDRHEVVLSDGAWTESFQPGDTTLGAMGEETRDEIYKIFPELAEAEGRAAYASARRALKRTEAALLLG